VDDDVELVEGSCPKCGGEVLRHDCTQIGCDDGFIDMHEYDDPLLFDEGEEEACNECHGSRLSYVVQGVWFRPTLER